MPTLTYDNSIVKARNFGMLLQPNVLATSSPLTGAVQTLEVPWPKWLINLDYPDMSPAEGRALDAFWRRVGGQAGRVLIWDLRQAGITGTQTAAVTLNGAHAQGATTLNLSGTTAGRTFKAADKIGIGAAGGQVVEVAADVTFSGSGDSITIVQSLRSAQSGGTSLVLTQPQITAMPTAMPVITHYPGYSRCEGGVSLVETF